MNIAYISKLAFIVELTKLFCVGNLVRVFSDLALQGAILCIDRFGLEKKKKVNDAIKIIMARSRSRERSRSRDRRHKSSKKSRRSRRSRSRSRSRSRTPKRYSTSSRHYKSSRSHYSSRRDRRRGSSSDSDHSSSSNSDRNSSEVRTIPLTSATAAGIGNKDIAVSSAAAKKKILEVERLAEIERQK